MSTLNPRLNMRGLYLITPDWDDTHQLLQVTEQALLGGVTMLQYRHKTASAELRREQAECLLALCRHYQKPLIINDHLDLCLDIDADGLHVGVTDASVAAVRDALGRAKILGASCYGDLDLAKAAQASGASYVAFGGFYASRVKQYPVTTSVDIIQQAKAALELPVVVIGGMTAENAAPLVNAGADMVAAISSVYLSRNPRLAALEIADLF